MILYTLFAYGSPFQEGLPVKKLIQASVAPRPFDAILAINSQDEFAYEFVPLTCVNVWQREEAPGITILEELTGVTVIDDAEDVPVQPLPFVYEYVYEVDGPVYGFGTL